MFLPPDVILGSLLESRSIDLTLVRALPLVNKAWHAQLRAIPRVALMQSLVHNHVPDAFQWHWRASQQGSGEAPSESLSQVLLRSHIRFPVWCELFEVLPLIYHRRPRARYAHLLDPLANDMLVSWEDHEGGGGQPPAPGMAIPQFMATMSLLLVTQTYVGRYYPLRRDPLVASTNLARWMAYVTIAYWCRVLDPPDRFLSWLVLCPSLYLCCPYMQAKCLDMMVEMDTAAARDGHAQYAGAFRRMAWLAVQRCQRVQALFTEALAPAALAIEAGPAAAAGWP